MPVEVGRGRQALSRGVSRLARLRLIYRYIGVGKLTNKRVLITGGDSGIGRSVALLMAREGAKVTISHLPSEDKDAREVKAQIEKEGSKCLIVAADLLKRDECKRLVDEHVREYGRIDVLVNNAGRQVVAQRHEDIVLDEVEKTCVGDLRSC